MMDAEFTDFVLTDYNPGDIDEINVNDLLAAAANS